MPLWAKAEDGADVNISEAKTLDFNEPDPFRAPCQIIARMLPVQVVICTLPSREEAECVLRRIAADLGAKPYTDYTQAVEREAAR